VNFKEIAVGVAIGFVVVLLLDFARTR